MSPRQMYRRLGDTRKALGRRIYCRTKPGTVLKHHIPMLNEQQSISKVISSIPRWVDDIIVVDNGSTDKSAEVAVAHGVRVIQEPRRGYGSACLTGIDAPLDPDVVIFLDGDLSDYPEEMATLVDPIINGKSDIVIGSRVLGQRKPGALAPQARFGNWLACRLIRLL